MSGSTAMRRCLGVAASAALLLAALGWVTPRLWPRDLALAGASVGPLPSRVYGVSAVVAGLAHDPARWLGTTLRVRGIMVGALPWHDGRAGWESVGSPRLADPATVAGDVLGSPRLAYPANMAVDVPLNPALALPVRWAAPSPLWTWLRRLPLLGGALPRPQAVQWDRLATYRVQLRAVPGRACPTCYEAVLLDTAGVLPHAAGVRPHTAGVRPHTAGVRPHTAGKEVPIANPNSPNPALLSAGVPWQSPQHPVSVGSHHRHVEEATMTQTTRFARLLLAGAAAFALSVPLVRPHAALADPVGPPSVPPALQVPAGNMVHLVGHATGTQNYACTAPNTWTFEGPQATLYGDNGHQIATHFAVPGSIPPAPEWQANDGSSVLGHTVAKVTVDATAIPWLLLSAVATSLGPDGGDRLAATTYIQRVNTTGGLAPTSACTVGDAMNVPYTADYYFYQAAESDGGGDD